MRIIYLIKASVLLIFKNLIQTCSKTSLEKAYSIAASKYFFCSKRLSPYNLCKDGVNILSSFLSKSAVL